MVYYSSYIYHTYIYMYVPMLNCILCVSQVDMIRKMMAYEPADRISAVEALQHEFFNPPDAAKPAGKNGSAARPAAKLQ